MVQSSMLKINFFLMIFSIFTGVFVLAPDTFARSDTPVLASDRDYQKELAIVKLNDIIRNIKQQKKEVDAKLRLLMKARTEQEKNRIQNELNELSKAIVEQESSFEMILTAGLELERDDTEEQEKFDWQKTCWKLCNRY